MVTPEMRMKLLLRGVGVAVLTLALPVTAQINLPTLAWQQSFGGTGSDGLFSLQPTADGGCIVGGQSSSGSSGNKTNAGFGGSDFWVVKLNADGDGVWEAAFGGGGSEGLFALQQTTNGGYVLGGFSTSGISGNKTTPGFGLRDFWIVRLDANGGMVWDRTYGGDKDDTLFALEPTADGGFVCAGFTLSGATGNKTTTSRGEGDFWVLRLDASGNKVWETTLGGTNEDTAYSLLVMTNGDIIVAGGSTSGIGGNKTSPNRGAVGSSDLWVLRLNSSGTRLWDRTFGSAADDAIYSASMVRTTDGGMLVGCDSYAGAGGNKSSSPFGADDFWVVRLDSDGNLLWDRSFGGAQSDYLTGLAAMPDGGFLLGGGSASATTGNKTSPNRGSLGTSDFWVVRLDVAGNRLWDQTYGGTGGDAFDNLTVRLAADGGLLLGGDSSSAISGNKTSPAYGGSDYWIVKLRESVLPTLRAESQQDITQNGFHFFLRGQPNQFYVIERSAALQSSPWIPISTNQLIGAELELADPGARNEPKGFYRARLWP